MWLLQQQDPTTIVSWWLYLRFLTVRFRVIILAFLPIRLHIILHLYQIIFIWCQLFLETWCVIYLLYIKQKLHFNRASFKKKVSYFQVEHGFLNKILYLITLYSPKMFDISLTIWPRSIDIVLDKYYTVNLKCSIRNS